MFRRILGYFGYGPSVQQGDQDPGPGTYYGQSAATVTFDTAMQLSAVWACARLLSETVASLPLTFHSVDRDGNETALENDVSEVFGSKVNRYQTRFEFIETMVLNLSLRGNAYALKQKVNGRLVGLLPLMSSQMTTRLLPDGSVVHCYYNDEGVTAFADESIWHLKLFGNGIIGLSPLQYARNAIGIALAGETRVSQIFQNGGKPSGVLTIDKILKPEQREQIRQSFRELREGNNDRLMVLEGDMKYQAISMSPEDIQLLESRRFQIEDICRFMGVPSVLVNDTSGSTTWGSGIEQLVQGFYKLNLRPYLERIEASIIENLMSPADRARAKVSFDFDALLRADRRGRAEANQKDIQAGIRTPNEVRQEEGLPPKEGGDLLYVNGTMVPLTQARAPARTTGGNNAA